MGTLVLVTALILTAAPEDSRAAPGAENAAGAEIDQTLSKLKQAPPPRVEILFDGIQEKRYKLVAGSFELDGNSLAFSPQNPQASLFSGELSPGHHELDVKLTYNEAQGSGIFEYADYKITVTSAVSIRAEPGLSSRIHVVVEKHEGAPRKKKLTLSSRAEAVMTAKIDDSPVPPLPAQGQPQAAKTQRAPALAEADDAGLPPPETAPEASDAKTGRTHQHERAAHAIATSGRETAARADDAGTAAPVAVAANAEPADAGAPAPVAAPETADAGVLVAAVPPSLDRRMLGFTLLGIGILVGLIGLFGSRKKRI